MSELHFLDLTDTSAHGDIASLLGLALLTGLLVPGTHVYGDAAAIRATIPGLLDWDGHCEQTANKLPVHRLWRLRGVPGRRQ